MPIYEYECGKCGVIEVMQKIKDTPLKKCPDCGCKVKKLVSQSSFHLKGSGWYATDYGSKSRPSAKKSEPAETKSTESKPTESKATDSKTSDSKPASSKAATSSESTTSPSK